MTPADPQPEQDKTPVGEPISAKRERFLAYVRALDLPRVGHPDRRNALRRFQGFCRRHVQELKDAGYSIYTVKTALTDYRNEVKRLLDGDELKFTLRYFTLTREEWWSLRRDYEAKVTAEASNTRPVNANEILPVALENLSSAAYTRQAAALMVLTGRRSIEVLKVGSVELIPGRSDQVLFEGQAKTHEIAVPPYAIPVLAPADKVVAAWKELRVKKDFTGITADAVNARCAKSLNETVAAMFGTDKAGHKYKPKDLRAIYALVCAESMKPDEVSRTVYLATILGHRLYEGTEGRTEGVLNRSIADSYEDFHLATPLRDAPVRRESEEISADLVGDGDDLEEPDPAPKHRV